MFHALYRFLYTWKDHFIQIAERNSLYVPASRIMNYGYLLYMKIIVTCLALAEQLQSCMHCRYRIVIVRSTKIKKKTWIVQFIKIFYQ